MSVTIFANNCKHKVNWSNINFQAFFRVLNYDLKDSYVGEFTKEDIRDLVDRFYTYENKMITRIFKGMFTREDMLRRIADVRAVFLEALSKDEKVFFG